MKALIWKQQDRTQQVWFIRLYDNTGTPFETYVLDEIEIMGLDSLQLGKAERIQLK